MSHQLRDNYDYEISGYFLQRTSAGCPEQYDVLNSDNEQVGYLRLRHGYFRADVPDCGGETVYESNPKGDGVFDDDERMQELTNAVHAIKDAIMKFHNAQQARQR